MRRIPVDTTCVRFVSAGKTADCGVGRRALRRLAQARPRHAGHRRPLGQEVKSTGLTALPYSYRAPTGSAERRGRGLRAARSGQGRQPGLSG